MLEGETSNLKAAPPYSELLGKPVSERKARLRFFGIFLALVMGYYELTVSPWVDANALLPVMKASAGGTSALLKLIGIKTTTEGVVVRGAGYALAVRRGCDPLEPIVLFAAGVIAFPTAWRRKLPGLVVGSAILFGLNLLRLVSLFLLGSRQSPFFDSFHLVWWPGAYLVFALGLWVLWLLWLQRFGKTEPSGAAHSPSLKAHSP
jgi:exosortase H (IPTLxxWG-CTERM-specific)